MFKGAKIVDIIHVKGEDGPHTDVFRLTIETECDYLLSMVVTIPDDPDIFSSVDIPAYDGRSVEAWLWQARQS